MKITKTKLLRTLFVIALIMYGITFNEEVNARTITEDEKNQICTEITRKIENKSKSVIENDFSNIKKITTYYSEEVGINSEELKNIAVGKPFMIYSLSDSKQSELYYYPAINNKENKVVAMIEVYKSENKWTYSIGTEYVEYLNEINYSENQDRYIFYSSEGKIYADDGSDFVNKYEIISEEAEEFKKLELSKKVKMISDRIDNPEYEIKTQSQFYDAYKLRMGYTPTMTGTTCQLYNPVGQGNYGLCWAACVATIANYRNGTNLTAMNVADAANIGYNDGGSLTDVTNSLHRYGLTDYRENIRTLTWDEIYDCIMNKSKPFYMSCYYDFSQSGHAVLCLGCKEISSNKYIVIWNPGLKSGAGGSTILKYYKNATTFSYGNETYVWYYSASICN